MRFRPWACSQTCANPSRGTDEAAGDTFESIEALEGSGFGDTLRGTDGAQVLMGGGGDDVLEGGAGPTACRASLVSIRPPTSPPERRWSPTLARRSAIPAMRRATAILRSRT
jgi:hypothetical protein